MTRRMLTQEELRAVQMTELELLREIDRICRKHGIRYCIIAGTLLGAVRHGGFIPWDDDADVAMLRPEYERFVQACRTDLDSSRFYFQDQQETPGYRWGYGKLRRKDSLFLREHQEHMPYEQGIFTDVFPLDAVPDGRIGRTAVDLQCYIVRKFLWARVGKYADPNPWKRRVYAWMDRVPEERLLRYFRRMVQTAGKRRSGWVRILLFPTPNRERGYRRSWYERTEEIRFEGYPFPGIADYDAYLEFKYGDYRQLPPPEQRRAHPVSRLRLPEAADGPARGAGGEAPGK